MNKIAVGIVALATLQPGCWSDRKPMTRAQICGSDRKPMTHAQICEEYVARLDKSKSELERFYFLARVAKCVLDDGDIELSQRLATEALDLASRFPEDWNYGNAIHDANVALGRIALLDGNNELAVEHLRLAGDTPGSPQLNSFGPNMTLARDLLLQEEWDPVYGYLEQCRAFWKLERGRIDRWQELVSSQRIPDFGANINY